MAEISSHKQDQERKKHGDPMEGALDEHGKQTPASERQDDPIPAPDNGSHASSHAAHLGSHVQEHTKPAGDLHRGTPPSELREPLWSPTASVKNIVSSSAINPQKKGAARTQRFFFAINDH